MLTSQTRHKPSGRAPDRRTDNVGTPITLATHETSKDQGREHCRARTKAGGECQAPAVELGLCFFHAHPEKLAELGRQGGKRNRRWQIPDHDVSQVPLKCVGDVTGLLEETINRVRQGPFDLRAANTIGLLSTILLKALAEGRIEDRLAHLEAAMASATGTTELFNFKPTKERDTHEKSSTPSEGD